MTKDDKRTSSERLAQALLDVKARRMDFAESVAKGASERARLEALQPELDALSEGERRRVLDAAGLKQVSAAPRPLTPVRGTGHVPRPSIQAARWEVWRHIPGVELWQAVALSLNIEPTESLATDAKRGHDRNSRLPPEYFDRVMVCKANLSTNGPIRPHGSLYSGMFSDPRCPVVLADLSAFMMQRDFSVPDEMRALVPAVATVAEPALAAAGPEHAASVAARGPAGTPQPGPEPHDAGSWHSLAQTFARQIIKRQADRDLYPSQVDIADEIARDFRSKVPPICGTDGKPLSGATIKRHALHGISSATQKAKSTAKYRGK